MELLNNQIAPESPMAVANKNYNQDSTNFDMSIFEVVDGKVNLTKICKYFNKDINEWKRLPNTQRFLKAYIKGKQGMGLSLILGRGKEQGTFGDRRIALKLAEWISVEFEIWANEKLDTLLQDGTVSINNQSTALPTNYKEALKALLIEVEKNEQLTLESEENKPKIDFADNIAGSVNNILIGEFAKLLPAKWNLGENNLYKLLREKNILLSGDPRLLRKYNTDWNKPAQEHIKNGNFKVKEIPYEVGDKTKTGRTTTITGKGQLFLFKKLKEWNYKI